MPPNQQRQSTEDIKEQIIQRGIYIRAHICVVQVSVTHTRMGEGRQICQSTLWVKKERQDTKLLPITFSTVNRFSKFFH